MAGGGGGRGSTNLSILLQTQRAPPSSEPFDPLFLPAPASSFLGTTSMLSFEHVHRPNSNRSSLFTTFEQEGNGDDDDFDEYFLQPEKKKKRLTAEQVQFLEKSFEVENKLEPERKIQLAKDLGLQPRQVAIWFQNRRARWKTKRLEKDYDTLQASFNGLKADYDNLLKENDKLKQEVLQLADKLAVKGKGEQEEPPEKAVEMVSCSKSDMFDSVSDSPHYTDGVQSFEPDQSDVTQDEEEDELSKTLSDPGPYMFPKLEDDDYSDPPASSCSFGFHVEDQAFWSSAY